MISLFPSRSVALELFGFSVHWYGLMYVLAFVLGIFLLPALQRYRNVSLTKDAWLDIISWVVVGVLVGGRLGFVFFYEPVYFLSHPLSIFAVWEGGMSSHGGFIGVAIVLILYAYLKKVPLCRIADVITVPAGIGLALGRIGNFINQELYGTPTALPWGISIPGVSGLRHPTQIYEMLTDLTIAFICYVALRSGKPQRDGRVFALFLLLYCVARFMIEFVREQQYESFVFGVITLTRGQFYTIPLFFASLCLWYFLPDSCGSVLSENASQKA